MIAGIVLALAAIGAARVLRLTYLASRSLLRAFGRGLAFVGGKLGTLGTRAPAMTRAELIALLHSMAQAPAAAPQAPSKSVAPKASPALKAALKAVP